MVKQISSLSALSGEVAQLKARGSIGFVPTMGALHAGHMALVERAKAENDAVVVSVFVNPLQFSVGEDLDAYPRSLEADKALLEAAGAALLFTPSPQEMYPQGFATHIHVDRLGDVLCGAVRSGHFDGVCTVVTKLLNLVQPSHAYFGEKDFQQLLIIKRMCSELNLSHKVVPVPTLREKDGLAMSSRNAYLTPPERAIAPALHRILGECASAIRDGRPIAKALDWAKQALLSEGFTSVDYLEYCDSMTLKPLSEPQTGARLLAAARLGKTRLIDNIAYD